MSKAFRSTGLRLAGVYSALVAGVWTLTALTTSPSKVGLDWIPLLIRFRLAALGLFVVLGQPGLRCQEPLPALFEGLKSTDLDSKNRASQALHAYAVNWIQQDPATMRKAFPAVMAALDDDDDGVRIQASAFFGVIGMLRRHDGRAILGTLELDLIERFNDPQPRVRTNLIAAISSLEPAPAYLAEAIEAFERHLNDPDFGVRGRALFGLARVAPDSPSATAAIVSLIDRTADPEERRGLIQRLALARPRHPAIVRKLIEQLSHDHHQLRLDSVRALGNLGPPAAEALPALRAILLDPSTNQELRQVAEAAIRSIETPARQDR